VVMQQRLRRLGEHLVPRRDNDWGRTRVERGRRHRQILRKKSRLSSLV
jgi:hypothetical protein